MARALSGSYTNRRGAVPPNRAVATGSTGDNVAAARAPFERSYRVKAGRGTKQGATAYLELCFNHWLNSELHLRATYEVQGVVLALLCLSQNQHPRGTLPDDDWLIARLLRMELPQWLDLQRAALPPLFGWRTCLTSKGERRLCHPDWVDPGHEAVMFTTRRVPA